MMSFYVIWSVYIKQFFSPYLCCFAPNADAEAEASSNGNTNGNANANVGAEVVSNTDVEVEQTNVNHPATIELIIDSCVVCQSEFENEDELSLLPCSHAFHTECIGTWLGINPSCPLCRSVVAGSNHPGGLQSHSSSNSLRVEIGNLSDR